MNPTMQPRPGSYLCVIHATTRHTRYLGRSIAAAAVKLTAGTVWAHGMSEKEAELLARMAATAARETALDKPKAAC